jgi:LRP1 type putative zinc finger protein
MAYSKNIEHKCQSCGNRATREIFNARNSSCGYYCPAHAKVKIAELNAAEKRTADDFRN